MAISRPPQIFRDLKGGTTGSWWEELPCPHSRSWGLHDISERDLQKLKRKAAIGGNFTKHMVIETYIYRAFLEFPVGSFLNQGVSNPTKALTYLQKAEDCTNDSSLCDTMEGRTGYGIVINAFRMRIRSEEEYELELRRFLTYRDSYPEYRFFVNATHAYFLSKLGPRWLDDCIRLYTLALKSSSHNCEWMYGMALAIGKKTRELRLMLVIDKPLPAFIRNKFREELDLLDRVLNAKPNSHHARALYGQALYHISWKDREARRQIDEALEGDPNNPDILVIFARYYRRKGLLKGLLKRHEHLEIAEIHCQIGYIYRKMSFKAKERHESYLKYQRLSLEHFNRAKELDNCHYPSISSAVEMTALLGMTNEARSLLRDMLEMFWRISSSTSTEFITIIQGIEKKFFGLALDAEKVILLSHRCIELALGVLKRNEKEIRGGSISSHRLNMIKTPLNYLEEMIHDDNSHHQQLAAKKLAHVYLLLERYDDAERLYVELNDGNGIHVPEVVWGLGKLNYLKGCREESLNPLGANFLWQNALHMADKLSELDSDDQFTSKEVYADVYLAKAKFMIRTQPELCMDALDQWNQCTTAEYLKMAISQTSLESCHIYLNHAGPLIQRYFFSQGVPETLAQIKAVCRSSVPLHTDFPIIDIRAIIIGLEIEIKEFILAKVGETIEYEASVLQQSSYFSTVFKMLEELREKRLFFEGELLKVEGIWHDSLEDPTISVLRAARELLDESIASCQKTLMRDPPRNSMFVVTFDFDEGKLNKEKAKKDTLLSLTRKTFKGFKGNEFLAGLHDRIIEMQPMYDEKNLWLAGLHSFNNMLKHSRSKLQFGETYELEMNKAVPDPSRWHFRTRDLVQQSCKEVESFALFCVSHLRSHGITDPRQVVPLGESLASLHMSTL